MISTMTGSINREVTPCQERLKASADCWLSLAAGPTFPIMALLTGVLGGGLPRSSCWAVGPSSGSRPANPHIAGARGQKEKAPASLKDRA